MIQHQNMWYKRKSGKIKTRDYTMWHNGKEEGSRQQRGVMIVIHTYIHT